MSIRLLAFRLSNNKWRWCSLLAAYKRAEAQANRFGLKVIKTEKRN